MPPSFRRRLLGVPENVVDLRHLGEAFGLDLRGTAGDHDPGSGRSRLSRRMDWRAWRVASAVTAHVLKMTSPS